MTGRMMRAAVLHGKRDVRIERVPVPSVGDNDVLVEMKVSAISAIEPIIYEGGYVAKDKIVAGFQSAGIVAEVGSKVTAAKAGQRVSFDPNVHCGHCYYCRRGRTLFCENLAGYGVHRTGTFAEYFSAPESNVYVLPDDMSLEDATMIEHASCVLHSVELSNIELGDTVVVLGCGVVGCMFVQLATARGAARAIGIDISEGKLAKARELGAACAVNASKEDVAAAVLKLTDGRGADVIYDAAGVPSALEQAPGYAAKGATIVIFATHPKEATVKINPFGLLEKEIAIQPTFCNPLTYGKALDMIAAGRLNVKTLVSAEVTLDEIVRGIEMKRDEDVFCVLVRN